MHALKMSQMFPDITFRSVGSGLNFFSHQLHSFTRNNAKQQLCLKVNYLATIEEERSPLTLLSAQAVFNMIDHR
jgi:hypothetical protein